MQELTAPVVAHQFDDAEQQHAASAFGMWLFLVTEIMFFGGLFTAYVVYRTAFPGAFQAAGKELSLGLGAFNTIVLLTSSLTMTLAVRGARLGERDVLVKFLLITIGLGVLFLGIKGIEYGHKWHDHLFPGAGFVFNGPDPANAQLFFSLYFAMTGLHALHMAVGIGLLSILALCGAQGMFNRFYYAPVENCGLYWHFVDLVWIFLFPLLYLLGRH